MEVEGWVTDGRLKAGKRSTTTPTVVAGTGSLTASIVAGTGSLIGSKHEVTGTRSPTVPALHGFHRLHKLIQRQIRHESARGSVTWGVCWDQHIRALVSSGSTTR